MSAQTELVSSLDLSDLLSRLNLSDLLSRLNLSHILSRLNLSVEVPALLPAYEDKDRYADRWNSQDQERYCQALQKMVNWPKDQENKVRA